MTEKLTATEVERRWKELVNSPEALDYEKACEDILESVIEKLEEILRKVDIK